MSFAFTSLDRQDRAVCGCVTVHRAADLPGLTASTPLIARGAGLSYVGAAFGVASTSLDMSALDRVLAFDPSARRIEVEAGIPLGKLYRFLTPLGLRLPVQPGYPRITVGGCIAGNVHGKNHPREGVFGRHVLWLDLFHPSHGILHCSASENAEVFALTLGGFGLTGIILRAGLALVPLEGGTVVQTHHPVESIEEAFAEVARLRDQTDMLYAWLDLSDPRSAGRGFIAAATATGTVAAGPVSLAEARLDPNVPELRRRPVFNRHSIAAVNRLYQWNALRSPSVTVPLHEFLFPALGKETYFHFYGDGGLLEQQTLIPAASVEAWIVGLRRRLVHHSVPVMLTTLKAFAGGSRSMLHYDGDGFSFTIDVKASDAARALLADLDALNAECGAATCIIKDSRLSAAMVRQEYPEYQRFRDGLRSFDPARLFQSTLSRRLEL